MSTRGLLVAACVCLPAFAGAAGAARNPVQRPPLTVLRGEGSYTKASRGLHSVHEIVIHATDGGSLDGNVWWLSGGHSHASCNYVIGRDGSIVQLVNLSDIAWQAGNWQVNLHSVGIEHVGDTGDPAGVTEAQYRASARLVAWLVHRYWIPVDRDHVIGHSQVPDPNHPGELGGSSHHTDPGPYWHWGRYMALVRRDAFPWRYRLKVRASLGSESTTLDGIVPWRAATSGVHATSVEFLVDGRLRWRDARAPFSFAGGRGLNTTELANGRHVLEVRAFGSGKHATQRIDVEIFNRAFRLTSAGLRDWQRVHGWLRVAANVHGARTTGIGLYVDGRVVSRDRSAPFRLRWNSWHVHDGKHQVVLAARAVDGRVVRRHVAVVVQNHPKPKHRPKPKPAPKPKPTPLPPPQVTAQNVGDGSTLTGAFVWRVHTTGPVLRVDLLVDGAVVGSATSEPWSFTWNTATVAPGPHVLTARAVTPSGATADLAAAVTVSG